MASRPISVKLKAENADAIVKALRDSGVAGQKMADDLEKSFTPAARAVDNLKRSLDPLYDAQQRAAQATGLLDRALKAGSVSADEHARLVGLVNQRYAATPAAAQQFVAANQNVASAINLNRQGLLSLQASGVNAFQALAAGMDPFRVATMEGAQVLGALVQGGVIGLRSLLGPFGLVAAAAAALGGAYLLLREKTESAADAEKRHTDELERAEKITKDLVAASDNRARSLEAERRFLIAKADAEEAAAKKSAQARISILTLGGAAGPVSAEQVAGLESEMTLQARVQASLQRALSGAYDDGRSGLFGASRSDLQGLNEDAKKAFEEEQKHAKEAADTIRKENEARDDAIGKVRQQVEDLGREADAIRQSERERFILGEQLKAEAALRKGLVTDNGYYIEQVRKAAAAKFDETERTKELADAESKARREAEQRAKEEQRRFERIVDEGTNQAANILYDAFTGKISSIGEFLKSTLARAASQGIADAFIRPLVIQPAVSAASGLAGSLGFGGFGSPNGVGTSLSAAGGLFDRIGGFLGFDSVAPRPSPDFMGPMPMAAGSLFPGSLLGSFLGMAGLGFGAGSLAANLIPGLNATNGMAGAGAGALIGTLIMPGVGSLIGGLLGGIGGGLLGPKPSVGPGQAGTLAFTNAANVYGLGADNGGNPAAAGAYLNALGQAVAQIVQASGGSGLANGGRSVSIGNNPQGFFVKFGNSGDNRFGSQDEATAAALRYLLGGGIAGASDVVNKVLGTSKATTADQYLSDVQFAIGVDRLKLPELERQIAAINDQYQQQIDRAKALGIAEGDLVKERDKQIAAARAQSYAPFAAAGGAIKSFLDAQSLAADSSLSPTGRLTEAQKQFGDLLAAVRGGDISSVSGLIQAGGNLITLGRQTYASSVDFANIEGFVRSSLASVGAQVTSEDYIRPVIAEQTKVQVDQFQQLKTELQKLRSDFQLLSKQLAA